MIQIQKWKQNEILRKISDEIKISEIKKYVKIGQEMIKYIKNPKHGWVWLAAPQIWINKRLIVVSLLKDREDENFSTVMMINPIISEHNNEIQIDTEWCLSVPWEKAKIERFSSIKLTYLDDKAKQKILILNGVSARILQHEIDHLDGILFTDRIKK